MLSDVEIKELIQSRDISIRPFAEDYLQPASYDLRVGRVLVAGRGIIDPSRERVILRTGDWAEIESLEELTLSASVAATYGVRSGVTRRGIDWFGGPQIDPGYRGKLFVSIFNPSSESFEIQPAMPFCTLMFHKLNTPASVPYSGPFQGLDRFPEEDVERMLKMQSPTLADVVVSVGILERAVSELTESTKLMARDLSWIRNLLLAILIALVIGITVALIQGIITPR